MKKSISLLVVGLVILCGIEAGAVPFTQVNHTVVQSKQTPSDMQINATNLTIIILGGLLRGGFFIKNVGEWNATNVGFDVNVSYKGLTKNITIEGSGVSNSPLLPGESYKMSWFSLLLGFPVGLGPVTIVVTAQAENAEPVTVTAEGIIVIHFVIIK